MSLPDYLSESLQGKHLLIFDFDGTVADTSQLHARAFHEVLGPLGLTVDYMTITGLKTLDALRCITQASGKNLPESVLVELALAKQRAVRQMMRNGLTPLAGVDGFLRWARSRFHLAMVTSGSRGTVSLALAALGYEGWFEPVMTADDVEYAKPDPEGLLRVLELTRCPADKALVFEDSTVGFEAAMRAGIAFIDVGRVWHLK